MLLFQFLTIYNLQVDLLKRLLNLRLLMNGKLLQDRKKKKFNLIIQLTKHLKIKHQLRLRKQLFLLEIP